VDILAMTPRPSVAFLLALARRLRGAAIVHCHGYTACTVGRLAALLAGRSMVYAHVHTPGLALAPRQRRIDRWLAKVSRKILCVSQAVQRFVIEQEQIPSAKTEVIYDGVAAPRLPTRGSARRRFAIPERARVIGCVASLTAHKGHAVLLDAVRLAAASLPHVMALIVGDGPLRSALESRAQAAGIPALFTGHLSDVGPALAAMDVLTLLSPEREGLSLALLEGLAASKPLVGSRVGGIPEVVTDGVNGLLCRPGDPGDAAACIGEILTNQDRAQAMGEAGRREYLARFTRERMLARIEQLYART
jgi:glycosyltransferase involved in cell wall biosynthesis